MDFSKLLLLAGAGGLVYLWYMGQSGTAGGGASTSGAGGAAGGGAGAGGGGGTATNGAGTGAGTGNGAGTGTGAGTPDAAVEAYRTMWASDQDGVRRAGVTGDTAAITVLEEKGDVNSIDGWNFYYNQLKTPVTPEQTDAMISGAADRGGNMSVVEYRLKLAGVGLSGLGMGDLAANYWSKWY